ncbi:histidine kinase dimerization/phospho-acceptor domain-containing protein [Clostridium sp.]|uniref:histidine kinase dimerization/phospho-acceptor domain-containing protein n=1 Tax=Clostridium sp. TaxID=1506 RepID=UPI0025BE79AB|nr:histidine kinase dimerization/phospho-acceptor domain-containing protein [Clostridium sp.]MCI9304831.1 GHKL domain-containing protein [Clostridium sp.]
MDIKLKNINKENKDNLELKKEKVNRKRIFNENSNKNYIIYILTAILLSLTILSGLEIKDNLRNVIPSKIYTETEIDENIYNYNNLVERYSLYYKSPDYTQNKDNITKNDLEICKEELKNKADSEYENYRNEKYTDNSFNNLTYEQQEKILNEEKEKINQKYNLTDEELRDYVLNRKTNSEKDLYNQIKSYVNLNFRSYDKINDVWIGGAEINPNEIISNSRYFQEINIDYNGNIIEKIFINGKRFNKNLNKFRNRHNRFSYIGFSSYESMNTQESIYEYDDTDKHNVTLYIWMPKELKAGDVIYESFMGIKKNENRFYLTCVLFIIFFVLLIFSIRYLSKYKVKSKFIEEIINKLKIYPIEYKVGVAILAWIMWNITSNIQYSYNNGYNNYIIRLNLSSIVWLTIIVAIFYFLVRIIIDNYNERTLFSNNITIRIWNYLSDVMKRGSIIRTLLIMTSLYIVIGLFLFFMSAVLYIWPIGVLAGLILTIVYIVLLIKNLVYLDKIMVGVKAGAEGKLNYKIDEKGRGHLRELAHDINNIKEGLKKSVENEMKSENMKTELITNVSHDLKTPLTSIINYIDLLKRENIEPESARDYVSILDKKSQRLKVLIEDLFEASKAASGAMELNITKIDVGQLLKQALGENDERFIESKLEVKLNIPNEKIFINGDGKRLYRVFENLISNIVKYSLTNTRVYIDMFKENDEVTIVMKNISAYELSFDTNEITNRFKRGDDSRSTEGSGLGLAIAKSIVELHNGSFKIEVDGDLFKSIIKLK